MTTRNARKAIVSHKRVQRKANALGKPPLCIDTNGSKKTSVYPDASNYKQGTANNKILQLREHLTRSNTLSNPNLLKEEQAMIDSMFSEKARQVSRERNNYTSNVYQAQNGSKRAKKRSQTKGATPSKARVVNSAAGMKHKPIRNSTTNRVLAQSSSKTNIKSQSM